MHMLLIYTACAANSFLGFKVLTVEQTIFFALVLTKDSSSLLFNYTPRNLVILFLPASIIYLLPKKSFWSTFFPAELQMISFDVFSLICISLSLKNSLAI